MNSTMDTQLLLWYFKKNSLLHSTITCIGMNYAYSKCCIKIFSRNKKVKMNRQILF